MSNGLNPRFSMAPKSMPAAHPEHADPADANGCWEWIEMMGKLGFTVSTVEMKYSPEALQQFGPPEVLARELLSEELGHFDSILQGDPFRLYFYAHTATLSAGLQFIKARLEAHGLLGLCKIAHADAQEKCWRTFYPALEKGGA